MGDLVSVTLLGRDSPGGRWSEIAYSGSSLQPLVNPANAATVGTRLAEYCAARPGQSNLTSDAWRVAVKVG